MLDVSKGSVYKMIEDDDLSAVRAGRTYAITRTHLVEYTGWEDVADDLIRQLAEETEGGDAADSS